MNAVHSALCILHSALALAAPVAAEVVRLPVTADNSIVMVDKEWQENQGGLGRIRIKGNQHMVAMAFDAGAIGGRPVVEAFLVAAKGDADIRGLTISTIAAPWDEHKSNSLTAGAGDTAGWGYAGARFPAVCGGNAFTLVCQAPSEVVDGWYRWRVHPDLVCALATGAACGLALHEWDADYGRNPTIFSREQSGKAPYLEVRVLGAKMVDGPSLAAPTGLRLEGDADDPRLVLIAPREHGFIYRVTVGGRPLGRWNLPPVEPGREQTIPLRDLPLEAGKETEFAVTAVCRWGAESPPAVLRAVIPAAPAVALPQIPDLPPAVAPPEGLAVIPPEDKYDAAGRPVGDLPADYPRRNAVFDGRTIRLRAARGEVAGFQALVRGTGRAGVTCTLPGLRVDLWQGVYVACEGGRRIPDPLVPLEKEVSLAADEAAVIVADVYVPFDFAGRTVEGEFALSDGRRLPMRVDVLPYALPKRATFLCEMNGYGLPDRASEFYAMQQVAYDHRVHVNLLAYGHSTAAPGARKCGMDMVMDGPAGDGSRRMDEKRYNAIEPGATAGWWDDFAAAFGPYLSGAYFKDGHRGAVPAPGFYLTFHESWPLNVRAFWDGQMDAREAFKARPEYAATFTAVLADFLKRAAQEGWTETGFQAYLNNKGRPDDPRRNPWTLDEPVDYWDYRALAYYEELVRAARVEPRPQRPRDEATIDAAPNDRRRAGDGSTRAPEGAGPRVEYRIDISRPEYGRGQLQPPGDLWVVSSSAFRNYHRLVEDRRQRGGLARAWVYGTSNAVEATNRTVMAWALEAYRGGTTGVVPWQTIDKKGDAMTRADQLGLFILTPPAAPGQARVVRHSMRLKAYRAAQQTVEVLSLLRTQRGLTPGRMRAFIDQYLDLSGTVRQAYAEDAGTPQFDRASPEAFRRLRAAADSLLGEK